jgi:hypothetical protein
LVVVADVGCGGGGWLLVVADVGCGGDGWLVVISDVGCGGDGWLVVISDVGCGGDGWLVVISDVGCNGFILFNTCLFDEELCFAFNIFGLSDLYLVPPIDPLTTLPLLIYSTTRPLNTVLFMFIISYIFFMRYLLYSVTTRLSTLRTLYYPSYP